MSDKIKWRVEVADEHRGLVPGGSYEHWRAAGAALKWRAARTNMLRADVLVRVRVTAPGQPAVLLELRPRIDWNAVEVSDGADG